MRLENFYTFKYCSPTRSSFLTARFPCHVNQANGGACPGCNGCDGGGADALFFLVKNLKNILKGVGIPSLFLPGDGHRTSILS